MSENSLFGKIATQVRGLLHDTVDNHSDAGREARQYVRDVEAEISQAEEQIVTVRADYNLLLSKQTEAQKEVDRYQSYAEKAIDRDNDQLAKEALTEKEKYVKQVQEYQARIDQLQPALTALEQQLAQHRARKDQMALDTDMLVARSAVAKATEKASTIMSGIGAASSASSKFSQLEAKVAKEEAKANARSQMAAQKDGSDARAKFAELDHPQSDIENQLAALKAQRKPSQ